jgi:hypothetical protein
MNFKPGTGLHVRSQQLNGPPSVSLSAATSSSERRTVVSPLLSTTSSSVRVVEATCFGIAL